MGLMKEKNNTNMERKKRAKILLVSFNSGWHDDVWNVLSIESLLGDLEGYFGEKVEIETTRLRDLRNIDETIFLMVSNKYDFIGFSLDIGSQDLFLILLGKMRENSIESELVCGGILATYANDYLLEQKEFNYFHPMIVVGEGEIAWRNIIKRYMSNEMYFNIPNTWTYDKKNGTYIVGEPETVDLNELIYPPARITYFNQKHKVHTLQTSRNCISQCSYCSEGPGKRWRSFPLERIRKDMEDLVKLGVNEFEFVDDEFFGGMTTYYIDRGWKIAETLYDIEVRYNVKIKFRIFTNPFIICSRAVGTNGKGFYELLSYMKQVGLCRVYLGVESGSIEQRKRYKRIETLEQCSDAMKMLRQLGIMVDAGFIMFDPEVQLEDVKNNISFIRNNNFLQYNTWPLRPMILTSGTPMYYRVIELGLLMERDEANPASFHYKYQNESVELLYSLVKNIADQTGKVFYILKYFYKSFFYEVKHKKTLDKVYWYLMKNAEINMNYMDDMINEFVQTNEIIESTRSVKQQLLELLEDIKTNILMFNCFEYSTRFLIKSIEEACSQLQK